MAGGPHPAHGRHAQIREESQLISPRCRVSQSARDLSCRHQDGKTEHHLKGSRRSGNASHLSRRQRHCHSWRVSAARAAHRWRLARLWRWGACAATRRQGHRPQGKSGIWRIPAAACHSLKSRPHRELGTQSPIEPPGRLKHAEPNADAPLDIMMRYSKYITHDR